jgi:uncharacterized protein
VTIEVLTARSPDELPAGFWSSFHQGAGVYQSRPWLEFVQQSAAPAVTYLAATENGQALGLMPVYPEPGAPGSGYGLTELAGVGSVPETALLCGNRRAYRNEMLPAAPPAGGQPGPEVLGTLTRAAAATSTAASPPALIFPYVSQECASMLCQAVPDAVPLLCRLDANIRLHGRSFDEYVHDLGQKKASRVRREMRLFERAGYTVGNERLADCWYEAGPLRRQAELLAGHDVVFTARRTGRLVALALHYEWNGTLASRVVGFDYDNLAGAMEYFNLNFYQPLEYACARGLSQILLGTGSEHAKQQRGATLTGLWTVVAGPGAPPSAGPGSWYEHNTRVRKQLTAAAPVEEQVLSDGWFGG